MLLHPGCCFGQDLHKLVLDRVPSKSLYGSDLEPAFIELGYKSYMDQATLGSKFLLVDIGG